MRPQKLSFRNKVSISLKFVMKLQKMQINQSIVFIELLNSGRRKMFTEDYDGESVTLNYFSWCLKIQGRLGHFALLP